jgi:hypothetical protein
MSTAFHFEVFALQVSTATRSLVGSVHRPSKHLDASKAFLSAQSVVSSNEYVGADVDTPVVNWRDNHRREKQLPHNP